MTDTAFARNHRTADRLAHGDRSDDYPSAKRQRRRDLSRRKAEWWAIIVNSIAYARHRYRIRGGPAWMCEHRNLRLRLASEAELTAEGGVVIGTMEDLRLALRMGACVGGARPLRSGGGGW